MRISMINELYAPFQSWARMAVFLLKLFPMLPSQPVNWITRKPLVEKVTYPALHGTATGDLYRPVKEGHYPAIIVFLGVVPFGTDHPQVPRLGEALARAGFAALLYWSPAMRDLRLEPADIDNVSLAYEWLLGQPYVDPNRSGMLGTCVGGSFALMAAASPRIRDRVSFLAAYAPYSSLVTLLQDAASCSTVRSENREPWNVDQLTRKVFVRSLTHELEPDEAEHVIESTMDPGRSVDADSLSANGRKIHLLLSHPDVVEAQKIMNQLPRDFMERLDIMSPIHYLQDIHSPLIVILHDQGDTVIPVGESRRLRIKLESHQGFHYRELQFQHLNPAKLPVLRLIRELTKFYLSLYPIFKATNKKRNKTSTVEFSRSKSSDSARTST